MTLLTMIFLHILDDFHLQGCLKEMKQKKWWTEHVQYKDMYKHDYIAGLMIHAFSWTFLIMLPIAYKMQFTISAGFIAIFVVNLFLHAVIDDLKANKTRISLCTDQALHIIQICATYLFLL